MRTLTVVVNGLGNLEAILPAASALAKNHVAYGVKASHYTPVGAALLWTLRARAWHRLDARNPERLERGLCDALEFHDRRGLRHAERRRPNEESAPRALEHALQKWEPVLRLDMLNGK